MKGAFFLALIVGPLLGLAIVAAWFMYGSVGDVSLGPHGWIALSIAVLATLGVGGGLMALVFYSARRGYDDDVARDDEHPFDPAPAPEPVRRPPHLRPVPGPGPTQPGSRPGPRAG